MFDKETIKEQVGGKSGDSYVAGLRAIEKNYDVSIDEEYEKDGCKSLLELLESKKKETGISETERHRRKDQCSHLKKYIEISLELQCEESKKGTWVDFYTKFATKLLEYKDNRTELLLKLKQVFIGADLPFPKIENGEPYDVDPFTVFAMFNKGISDTNRIKIINSIKNEFQIKAITPEDFSGIPVVNNLKATFYYFGDERKKEDIQNLWDLFSNAIEYSENQNQENKDNVISSYQNVIWQKGVSWNITMALFWIRPHSYINLDSRMRETFKNNAFFPPFDKLISEKIKSFPSGKDYFYVIEVCKNALKNSMDMKSFIDMSIKAWEYNPWESVDNNWWPSLDEYNPNLTKDDWKKYILEVEKPHHPSPMKMLKGMLELGGEASCKQLTAVYGGHPSKYVGCAMNLGRRAKKYFNLPVCMDDGQERYFPIPFLGKAIDDEDGHQYIYKIRSELLEALNELDLSDINPYYEEGETLQMNSIAKNTILYGPPGTGKTYNTACYAVAIVENKDVEEILEEANDNYSDVFERYTSYKNDGLIQFVTFHQSYGYEDFIEGIKPVLETEDEEQKDLQYKVADGVFKAFCNTARNPISQNKVDDLGLNKNPTVWKVSLWSTGDNSVRTECMENGHIRIGWDDYGPEITSETDFSEIGGRNVLNSFIYKMQKGDIVLSCYSSTTIDAVGVVTGDYEWSGEYDDLNRVRKVNWLVKGIEEDIVELNDGNVFTLAAVYKTKVSVSDALSIVEKYNTPTQVYENRKQNMAFIIDEINRGNISKIFGELITLIEDSKRLGAAEELKVVLPYSQKPFGVPANVYILGTMNTADRSIAALDTALRRRFSFVEMMPDTDVLENVIVEGVNISKMLTRMNKRIEVLFDREHTIGHAYFINLTNSSTIDELAEIFENKIIPLLQEYFYEDYERIRLVLADNQVDQADKTLQFITCEDVETSQLFGNADENVLDDMKTFTINKEALKNPLAYQKIYK